MNAKFIGTLEASEILGIDRNTVYKYIRRFGLPAYQVGAQWFFKEDEVIAWIEGRRFNNTKKRRESKNAVGVSRKNAPKKKDCKA